MNTQRDNPSWHRALSLLLLGLVLPLATSQTLSYRDAVLRAVEDINQRSLDTNLYRLLDLDPQSPGDENPDTPKYVRFRVKETVCDKLTQQLPEQCDFKEHGLVKQCMGTVNQAADSFDIDCNRPGAQLQRFKKVARLAELLRKGGQKLAEKFEKIGQKIKNIFEKIAPEVNA